MLKREQATPRRGMRGAADSFIVIFRRLLEPLTVSVEPEPMRGRMVPRRLAGQIDLLQSFLVLLTIIIQTWVYGQLKTWIVGLSILGYIAFIFGYRWLVALGPEKWRLAAGQVRGVVLRAMLLMLANGVFLWLLYTQTDHLMATRGQSSLWLLFIFANLNMLRRRRIFWLVWTTIWAVMMLAPSEHHLTTVYLEQPFTFFLQQLLIRGFWIAALSYVFYGTLSIIDAKVQAFLVVQRLTGEWYGVRDAHQLAEKVTDELIERFGFHQAQVFIQEGDRLVMMAAGTAEADQLVKSNFSLELPLDGATPASLNAACFNFRKPITVNDVYHDPDFKNKYYPHEVFKKTRAEMCVPLFRGDEVIGTLDVMSHKVNDFVVPNDEELLMTIARSLGTAMSNALDAERLEQQRESLEIVDLLSTMSFSVIELPDVMNEIVERARTWSQAHLVTLYELSATSDYKIRSGPYQAGELLASPLYNPEETWNFIAEVARGGHPVFIDDTGIPDLPEGDLAATQPANRPFRIREKVRSVAALPLLRGGTAASFGVDEEPLQVIGVLIFNYRDRQRLEWDEERRKLFITFASLASLAMQRSTLSETEAGELIERRFRDIHDFLLSRVGLLLATINERMARADRATAADLRAIQAEVVELQSAAKGLKEYRVAVAGAERVDEWMKRFIRQMQRDYPTRTFHLELPLDGKMDGISPDVTDNLMAICYEAIYNGIRHGEATEFWVQLTPDEEAGWMLSIEDNGHGFDPAAVVRRSGLRNMERRAEGLGGELTVTSNRDIGTIILVTIPDKI